MKVRDFDASLRFYVDGLGCKKVHAWGEGDGRAVMLDTGAGDYMEIFAGLKEEKGEGWYTHVAFRTDDCKASLDMAVKAGAVVTIDVMEVEIKSESPLPITIAFCKGPDGEIIEFFQERR